MEDIIRLFDYVETVILWLTNYCGERTPVPCMIQCHGGGIGYNTRNRVLHNPFSQGRLSELTLLILSVSLYNLLSISLFYADIKNTL